MIENKQIN